MQDLPVCTERLDAGAMSPLSFNPAQFFVAMASIVWTRMLSFFLE